MNLFALTRELIDIPSVSGAEAAVTRHLSGLLKDLGYQVELQPVTTDRANLFAQLGHEPAQVILSTHLDTVPPFIASSADETFIYGRGACDAKGIIAAQILAAEQVRASGFQGIGLLFTVDEEVGSLGARAANELPAAQHCRFLINGEPTENLLASGSKGSLRVRLNATGKAAHSAYPENGDSAIERLLDVLSDIRAARWPSHEFFGATTCNIGTIQGGTRTNVIPALANAELHFRLAQPAALTIAQLESVIAERVQLEILSCSEPVRTHVVAGFDQAVVRFTTDIPYLTNWGQPLLVGPGSILDAHTDHERVAKTELSRAVQLYADLATTLLTERAQYA